MKRWLLCLGLWFSLGAAPAPERSNGGMVATDHEVASQAGAEILQAGGNAVDAAIAAALACGVVQPASSGLGGGGFAVVVEPNGQPLVLDFREVAPAAATRDMFVQASTPDASRVGGLAVGVPGETAGLIELHRRFGSLSLKHVAAPAVRLASKGFQVEEHLEGLIEEKGDQGEVIRCQLFDHCGNDGEVVRRTALGKALRLWAKSEGRYFLEGEGAANIVAAAKQQGGILTLEDLAQYSPREREPIVGHYRGWTLYTMPPPSSGGLVLLQVLQVLEGYDLSSLGHNSSSLIHLYAEAMQHAFADRAEHMGDPERVNVPVATLLERERIEAIRGSIDVSRTFDKTYYGTRIDIGTDGGTQHISVLDANGMAVSLTSTINTSFGSQVVTDDGLVLNNEMDDFVARPGEPNYFGLVGSEANAVAAGSRPLSSMSPTILISPDGTQRIVVGASGGPFIISSTLQAIVNIIDFGMDASEAVSVPRMHHQWVPEKLFLDRGFSNDTIRALKARGHEVEIMPFFSSVQLLWSQNGEIQGASDPRKGGWPGGSGH